MNRYLKGIILLAMMTIIAVPIFADDFKDLVKRIDDALKDENTSSFEKANMVRKLAGYPSADTVEYCYKILKYKDKNAKSIEREMKQIQTEIDDYKKKVADIEERFRRNNNTGTQDEINRRKEYLDEIAKRQKTLLELEDKLNSMNVAKTAVIYVLGKMDDPGAKEKMLEGLDEKDWRVVYATIEGCAKLKFKEAFDKIAQHYPVDGKPHKSDYVRKSAIVALRLLDQKRALKNLIVALGDDNVIIRTQAVYGLGEIGEKECILPLINQMEKESGRLQSDIITILTNLTGKGFADNATEWRSWWKANKDKVELKKVDNVLKKAERGEGSHKTEIKFYDVDVDTDHPIFIIDQSGSMQAAADVELANKLVSEWLKKNPGKENQIPPIPPPPPHLSKWQVLQNELKNVIMSLDSKKADFNIVWYSTEVEIYNKGGMVEASPKEKDKAAKEIDRRSADGFTNIYDALETAFMLATGKEGKGDSEWTGKGDSEMLADTFFFMTDGVPDDGDRQNMSPKKDINNILAKVREWNKIPKIKIYAIGVGNCATGFLEALATENGGTFTHHTKEPEAKKKK